jgi:biotin carboxyl carrier protein
MKHIVAVDGRDHEIWLAHIAGGNVLDIDGRRLPVSLANIHDDRYRLVIAGEVIPVTIVTRGDRVFVHAGGSAYEAVLCDPVNRYADEAKDIAAHAAIAPMPGTVIATPVSTGDRVSAGDVLVVIESMKLETAIRATHAGLVETVHVGVGQTFERGSVLVSLAPTEAR